MLISWYKLRTTYLYNLQISIVTHCARASMYLNWLNIILLPLQSPHKRPSSFLESELEKKLNQRFFQNFSAKRPERAIWKTSNNRVSNTWYSSTYTKTRGNFFSYQNPFTRYICSKKSLHYKLQTLEAALLY